MQDESFLKWLALVSPNADVIPHDDRYTVIIDSVDEADILWRSRYLLDRPIELIIGRRYSPSVELQLAW